MIRVPPPSPRLLPRSATKFPAGLENRRDRSGRKKGLGTNARKEGAKKKKKTGGKKQRCLGIVGDSRVVEREQAAEEPGEADGIYSFARICSPATERETTERRGVAWRGVPWRGVAWRGVAWRGGPSESESERGREKEDLESTQSC